MTVISCADVNRIWNSNPYPGMIRLQGGPHSNIGHVQVYCNGHWGAVCSNGFDNDDADTVCKQLGYDFSFNYGSSVLYVSLLNFLNLLSLNFSLGQLWHLHGALIWVVLTMIRVSVVVMTVLITRCLLVQVLLQFHAVSEYC